MIGINMMYQVSAANPKKPSPVLLATRDKKVALHFAKERGLYVHELWSVIVTFGTTRKCYYLSEQPVFRRCD